MGEAGHERDPNNPRNTTRGFFMRILIADKLEQIALDGLAGLGAEVISEPDATPEGLGELASRHEARVLVVRSTRVPADVFERAASLKLVIRAGSGYDSIDCEAAGAAGVAVCNTPGMNGVAVAELTMGHLLSLDRRLPAQDAELRAGRWNKKEYSKARGLKGRSLLVVGGGAIGLEVVRRAKAFDMRVGMQSRSLTESQAGAIGVEPVGYSREALLAALPRFDAVTMHVPLTDDSRKMCDGAFFEAMAPGASFINTSRGGIVDEDALIRATRERGIRAAVDVYDDQPSFKDGAFRPAMADEPGIQFSHHVGASTDQAQDAVAEEVVRIVRIWQESGTFEHCVNARELQPA